MSLKSSEIGFDKAELSAAVEESYCDADFRKSSRFRVNFGADFNADFGELDAFFRLFRVPGMFHCNSGPGAWVLGQGGSGAAAGIQFTPEQNVLAALVAWVEEGKAPETIGGVKFMNDTVGSGVAMGRRHCRYPYRHTYTGGNSTIASSWTCL